MRIIGSIHIRVTHPCRSTARGNFFFKFSLAIDPMFPYSISRTAWGRSSAGRALDWQSRGQGFDPPRLHPSEQPPSEQSEGVLLYGLLAQRLAQGTHNPWVEGSNPPGPTNNFKAGLHAWPFSIRFAEPFVLLCCLPEARNQLL